MQVPSTATAESKINAVLSGSFAKYEIGEKDFAPIASKEAEFDAVLQSVRGINLERTPAADKKRVWDKLEAKRLQVNGALIELMESLVREMGSLNNLIESKVKPLDTDYHLIQILSTKGMDEVRLLSKQVEAVARLVGTDVGLVFGFNAEQREQARRFAAGDGYRQLDEVKKKIQAAKVYSEGFEARSRAECLRWELNASESKILGV